MLLAFGLFAGSGVSKLTFDGNYRVFFGADNPELLEFNAFQNIYTRNDNLFFIVHDEASLGFSRELAEASEYITRESWTIPYATRVDSITNYQHTYADGEDSLVVEDLIRNASALTDEEIARRGSIAMSEPTLAENIISQDGTTAIVSVTLPFPELDVTEIPDAVQAARLIRDQATEAFPNLKIAISGTTMFNNAFNEAGANDAQTLIPLTYIAMLLLVLILLRSISGTIATFVIISLATATALGLAGHIGLTMMPIAIAAPTIILTIAVADSVHLISGINQEMTDGRTKKDAISAALDGNGAAIMLTSLTTAIGFLSMNFSDSPPFRVLGTVTAMGVIAAWLYTIVLLPVIVSLLPIRAPKAHVGSLRNLLRRYSEYVIKNRTRMLVGGSALTMVFAVLAFTNTSGERFPEYFDYRMPFRADLEFGIEKIKTADMFEVSVSSGIAGGINESEYLQALDSFVDWLRARPDIRHVYAYSDILRRLNMNMHDDDPAWKRLPESKELAAQYLLLYELSLPYGLDMNDRIAVDKSATRVTISLEDITSTQARSLAYDIQDWFIANGEDALEPARATGPSVMFSFISQRNVEAMVSGTLLAVLLVAATIIVGLRNVTYGLLSIVPNIAPALIAFGFWALIKGDVGMAGSVIGATSLGIVVDDTIHFITKFLHARRKLRMSPESAIEYTFTRVGPAILITTLIVTIGFAVLATSVFVVNSQMGLLTGITILVAQIFDFTVLPALLLTIAKRRQSTMEEAVYAN